MTQRASSVGEHAHRFLLKGGHGTVTRVFKRSAYVRAGSDFILLLWGGARSPMTINLVGDGEGTRELRAGEDCELGPSGIRVRDVMLATEGSPVYRSALRKWGATALPRPGDLAGGVSMLKSLYDASPQDLSLVSDPLFKAFTDGCLVPAAHGKGRLSFDAFLALLGRGGGFTPAGDDFTAGFTSVFNYIARSRRSGPIVIPRRLASSRTIPESAAIMVYSSRGHVDEELQRLILNSLGGRGFRDDLMSLASRGHTSGMDMSLGVLLAEAFESGRADGGRTLDRCLGALWPAGR